jgi:hypothetical protein
MTITVPGSNLSGAFTGKSSAQSPPASSNYSLTQCLARRSPKGTLQSNDTSSGRRSTGGCGEARQTARPVDEARPWHVVGTGNGRRRSDDLAVQCRR